MQNQKPKIKITMERFFRQPGIHYHGKGDSLLCFSHNPGFHGLLTWVFFTVAEHFQVKLRNHVTEIQVFQPVSLVVWRLVLGT